MVSPRWVFIVVLAVAAAGCSGGGDDEADARRYADDVCAASLGLARQLEPVMPRLEQAAEVIESFQSVQAVGDALRGLGGVVEQLTPQYSEFVDAVKDVDPPDVDGGEQFHEDVVAVFERAEPGFAEAATLLQAIPAKPTLPDLADVQSEGVSEALNVFSAYEEERDDAPEVVRTALTERPRCQEVDAVFARLPEVLAG